MNDRRTCNPSPPPSYFEEKELKKSTKVRNVKRERDDIEEGECIESDIIMKTFLFEQLSNRNDQKFTCEVCKSEMNTQEMYLKHLKGKRHQKKMAAHNYVTPSNAKPMNRQDVNVQQIKTTGCPMLIHTRPKDGPPLIQSALDDYRESPIIGLNFVCEIQMDNDKDPVYYCRLCPAEFQSMAFISHVIGFKHRLAYMKLVDPKGHLSIENSTVRKSILGEHLEHFAAKYEAKDGRGVLMVEVQVNPDEPEDEDFEVIVERRLPIFPPSVNSILRKQAASLKKTKHSELTRKLVKSVMAKTDLNRELQNKFAAIVEKRETVIHDSMIKQMNTEMKKLIYQKVKEEDYFGIVKLMYKMDCSLGMLARPLLATVMRKPGIICPIKQEPK